MMFEDFIQAACEILNGQIKPLPEGWVKGEDSARIIDYEKVSLFVIICDNCYSGAPFQKCSPWAGNSNACGYGGFCSRAAPIPNNG